MIYPLSTIIQASLSFALKIGFTFLSLGITALLARALGTEDYGVYTFIFAVLTLFLVPVQNGVSVVVTRFTAIYSARGCTNLLSGLRLRADQVVLLLGIVVACIGVTVSTLTSGTYYTHSIIFCSVFLFLGLGLLRIRESALLGIGRVISGQLPNLIIRPCVFLVLLVVFWNYESIIRIGPEFVLLLHSLAAVVALLVATRLIAAAFPRSDKTLGLAYEHSQWLSSAVPLLGMGAIQTAYTQADILMIGLFQGPEDVGVYRAAVQCAALISFILSSINAVLAPAITSSYETGNFDKLQTLATTSARISLLIGLPTASIFFFSQIRS